MTARDSLDAQPTTLEKAVLLDCLERVLGTGRRVDAPGAKEGREVPLVPPDSRESPPDEARLLALLIHARHLPSKAAS